MPERSLGELARLVGGDLEGAGPERAVRGFASLETAGPEDLSFLVAIRHVAAARASRAAAFIVPRGLEPGSLGDRPLIRVAQPYAAVAVVLRALFPEPEPVPGVHPTAHVATTARIAPGATVGAFSVVEDGASVEAGAVVHPHVFVGPGCRVGEGSVLHPHVVLRAGVVLGRRVVIHPGAVLGADGFGYVFDGGGHRKIPQVGQVMVGDDVEIGANSAVDRATLGETVIGRGTKIDNLVQIGHNVRVGADGVIVAQAGIAGSARLGDRVVVGGQVGIADHATVGDGARIGSQSGVHGEISAGADVVGSPAMPAAVGRRAMVASARLPELVRAVRALARRVEALERGSGR